MADLIDRQAAIKAFKDFLTIHDSRGVEYLCSAVTMDGVNKILSDLPPAQTESQDVTDTNVGDMISRQEAIKALCKAGCDSGHCGVSCDDVKAIEDLPSADELAIVAEHCRKRNLVLITMESFRVLQAYYNRQNGMDGEHDG